MNAKNLIPMIGFVLTLFVLVKLFTINLCDPINNTAIGSFVESNIPKISNESIDELRRIWLTVWLGPVFGEQGQGTVIWLCAGVLTNGVAQILFAKVQGAGLSAWTAKLHLLEIIPYLGLLWFALNEWGITGAAFAWFVRVLIDLIGLAYFTHRINPLSTPKVIKKISLLLVCVGIILIPLIPLDPTAKWVLLTIISCSYVGYSLKQLHRDHALNWLLSLQRKY